MDRPFTSSPNDASSRFELAVEAHQSGDLPLAEEAYRAILRETPDDPVVLQLLGTVFADTGRVAEGLACLERSVGIDPESGPAWAQLALTRLQASQLDAAIEAWTHAWKLEPATISHLAATFAPLLEHQAPERPDCWQLAGEARLASGQNDSAERDFRNAMSHPPTEDAARTSLGGLLLLAGASTEAVEVLRTNRPLESMSTSRRINLAQAYFHNGAHEQAILALEGLRPQHDVEIRAVASTRAQSALRLGTIDDAETAVNSGLEALPNDPVLSLLASDIDRHRGRWPSAVRRLRSALAVHDSHPGLRVRLAHLLVESGEHEQALSTVGESSLDGTDSRWPLLAVKAAALANLGQRESALEVVRSAIGSVADSRVRLDLAQTAIVRCRAHQLGERILRDTLAADPSCLAARRELCRVLLHATLYRDALEVIEADPAANLDPECRSMSWRCRIQLGEAAPATDLASAIAGDNTPATDASDLLLTMQYADHLDECRVAELHRDWQRCLRQELTSGRESATPRLGARSGRPLRVGFLSADLRRHAVAFFLSQWLDEVDRSRVECIALSVTQSEDEMTSLLKSKFVEWRDFRTCTSTGFRDQVARDGIDILVELGGHTAGSRLELLHPRAAPIQISWLGYPNTTGLDTIDFRLVDEFTDPESHTWHGTERLLRMRAPFLCYGPPTLDLPTDAIGGRPATFGSFNNLQKISDRTVHLWASTVRSARDARLLLKSRGLEDQRVRDRLAERFEAAGLDRGRLDMCSPDKDLPSHLSRYQMVDVALDPFPYHGTTTTCEALWMGVPVVSRIGETHRSRVGLTLSRTVGLQHLCAGTDAEFIEIAAALIQERYQHPASRASLRTRVKSSSLCNSTSFAERFTEALEWAWSRSAAKS